MGEKAILLDTSRCTGCHGCQVACKTWNNLPSSIGLNENKFSGSHQNPPDINGQTRLIVTYNEQEGGSKGIKWAFGRRGCQHCTDAPCVEICPAGALSHDENGFVVTDDSKCIACQYCSSACPFDVPQYDGLQGTINKCTGCPDRVENGMAPACVTTCQPEALQFGDRDELLADAKVRLEALKERGYEDAVLYGEEEMGGLHVIEILKHGAEAHGAVVNPHKSAVTSLTEIVRPLTGIGTAAAVAGFGLMTALAAGYSRRRLTYNPETQDTIDIDTGEVVKHGDPEDEMTIKEHLQEAIDGFKGGKDE